MQNGTSRILARVFASRVLPDPVGSIRRILLFSISTSANGSGCKAADVSAGDKLSHLRVAFTTKGAHGEVGSTGHITASEKQFLFLHLAGQCGLRDRR